MVNYTNDYESIRKNLNIDLNGTSVAGASNIPKVEIPYVETTSISPGEVYYRGSDETEKVLTGPNATQSTSGVSGQKFKWTSATGTSIEINGDPGNEVAKIIHHTGSGIQIDPDGGIFVVSNSRRGTGIAAPKGDAWIKAGALLVIDAGGTLSIRARGDLNIDVGGNLNLSVEGSIISRCAAQEQMIDGNSSTTITGDSSSIIGGISRETIAGDVMQQVSGNLIQNVKGNTTSSTKGNVSATSKGTMNISSEGNQSITSKGTSTFESDGNMTIASKANVEQTSGGSSTYGSKGSMSVKSEATLTQTSAGNMTIGSSNMNITASSSSNISASTMNIGASGMTIWGTGVISSAIVPGGASGSVGSVPSSSVNNNVQIADIPEPMVLDSTDIIDNISSSRNIPQYPKNAIHESSSHTSLSAPSYENSDISETIQQDYTAQNSGNQFAPQEAGSFGSYPQSSENIPLYETQDSPYTTNTQHNADDKISRHFTVGEFTKAKASWPIPSDIEAEILKAHATVAYNILDPLREKFDIIIVSAYRGNSTNHVTGYAVDIVTPSRDLNTHAEIAKFARDNLPCQQIFIERNDTGKTHVHLRGWPAGSSGNATIYTCNDKKCEMRTNGIDVAYLTQKGIR